MTKAIFLNRFKRLPLLLQDTFQEVVQEMPKRCSYFAGKLNVANPTQREQLLWALKQPGAIALYASLGMHGAGMAGVPFLPAPPESAKRPEKPPEFVALTPQEQARIPGLTLTPPPNSPLNSPLAGLLGAGPLNGSGALGSSTGATGSSTGATGSLSDLIGTGTSYDYGRSGFTTAPNYTFNSDSGSITGSTPGRRIETFTRTEPDKKTDDADKAAEQKRREAERLAAEKAAENQNSTANSNAGTPASQMPCVGQDCLKNTPVPAQQQPVAANAQGTQAGAQPGQANPNALGTATTLGGGAQGTGNPAAQLCPAGQAPLSPTTPATPNCVSVAIAQSIAALDQGVRDLYQNKAFTLQPSQSSIRVIDWIKAVAKAAGKTEDTVIAESKNNLKEKEIPLECGQAGCDGKTTTLLLALSPEGNLLGPIGVLAFTGVEELDAAARKQLPEVWKNLPAQQGVSYHKVVFKFKAKSIAQG